MRFVYFLSVSISVSCWAFGIQQRRLIHFCVRRKARDILIVLLYWVTYLCAVSNLFFFVINYASIAYYSYTRESLHTISNEISYRVPNKTLIRHLLFEYLSAVCVSLTQHSHRYIITASENIFSRPARVHRAFWHHCQCPGASAFRTQYFPI